MRLICFTNLFPSASLPRHGIFVEERLLQLGARAPLQIEVLALRPSSAGFFGSGAGERPREDTSFPVRYLRVPTLPKVSNWVDPWLWANAAEAPLRALVGDQAQDTVLDAHFLYPDGVAAVLLGRRLGLPVVVTARGSDVNVKCEHSIVRAWVRWAAAHAAAVVTVSQALAHQLQLLRLSTRIEVLPNGVDLVKFAPRDSGECRARFGVESRALATVGHLIPDKGHALVIDALADLPGTTLLVVGEGPERSALEARARALGVESRVRFLGLLPHGEMGAVYNAVDGLVLASAREGMPNVVLESLACGTPVVATDVGGVSEVLGRDAPGRLVPERSAGALSRAVQDLFAAHPGRKATRDYALRFGWTTVIERQLALYARVLSERAGVTAPPRLRIS